MKKHISLLITGVAFISNLSFGQSNSVASGGNGSGSGGSVSYSIGQIDYVSSSGSNGSINQGVQQPYEFYLTSGIEEYDQLINISIGPNPTIDVLNIILNEPNENLFYKLLDINGKELITKNKLNQNTQIDLSSFAVGNYMLTIMQSDKIIQSYKIIKK